MEDCPSSGVAWCCNRSMRDGWSMGPSIESEGAFNWSCFVWFLHGMTEWNCDRDIQRGPVCRRLWSFLRFSSIQTCPLPACLLQLWSAHNLSICCLQTMPRRGKMQGCECQLHWLKTGEKGCSAPLLPFLFYHSIHHFSCIWNEVPFCREPILFLPLPKIPFMYIHFL